MKKAAEIVLNIPATIEFIHFVNDVGESFIKRTTKVEDAGFLNELRIILYELFSNVVNHCKSDNASISFSANNESLSILVNTKGSGFGIKPVAGQGLGEVILPPYNGLEGHEFIVYQDIENKVYCKVRGNQSLVFRNEKIDAEIPNTEIPEHYGMYLITVLTDSVEYERFSDGTENFRVVKKFTKGDENK